MMRAALPTRLICLGVVAALSFAIVRPAWAQEEEGPADFKDPTIVTDDSTSVPDGVKDLAKKPEKKPIVDPVYEKWWFWAAAVGVAGAWIAFAVWPLQKKAPSCGGGYTLGCFGDGR
jgi:hypothetical protein